MQRNIFEAGGLGEYHDSLILIKVAPHTLEIERTGVSLALSHGTMGFLSSETAKLSETLQATKGFAALEFLNRAGRIRSVTPLSRKLTAEGRRSSSSSFPGATVSSLVSTAASTSTETISERIEHGVSLVEIDPSTDFAELERALADDPNVVHVSKVPVRYLCLPATPAASPPGGAPEMWNLHKIKWREARRLKSYVEPTTIKVAVLDTGIDPEHPDLAGRVKHYEWFPHLADPVTSGDDIVGHGTHVAGTISAGIANHVGIAGVCQTELWIWKIFGDQPYFIPSGGYFAYVVNPIMYLQALFDCLDMGVDVINLSIGGSGKPSAEELQLFNALTAGDTVVVAAIGNERRAGSPTSYPAAITDVIAVGATRPDDRVARFSNRGNHIALSAPGVAIWSTLPRYPGNSGFEARIGPDGRPRQGKPLYRETDYDAWDGTSMATPHVSAAVAMLLAKVKKKRRKMTLAQVRKELESNCDKVPGMGTGNFHPDYGTGRLNLLKLLR